MAKTRDNFFAGVDVRGNCEVSRAEKLFDDSKEDSKVSKNVPNEHQKLYFHEWRSHE